MKDSSELRDALFERFGERLDCALDERADNELSRIAAHRCHRAFADKDIDQNLMQTLLACALSAPSKSDLQQVSIVWVRETQRRRAVERTMPAMRWVPDAPEFLVFCGDNARIRKINALRERPFENDHLDSFFNATVDAALVLMNFVRAAEAAGLGCCPLSVLRDDARSVSRVLELPQHVFPVAGLAVGFPKTAGGISARLPLSLTVHIDRYDDTDLEQAIDAYDRRRGAREPIAPEAQREQRRFGLSETYGWSEDKARQVSVRQRGNFGAFVREQGFCLD